MTTTTRAAANRPMSAPNVPLVLMIVLWVILLSVVAPSLGCGVSVVVDGTLLTGTAIVDCEDSILIVGCVLLVVISLTLPSPSVLAGVHSAIVGGVGGVHC